MKEAVTNKLSEVREEFAERLTRRLGEMADSVCTCENWEAIRNNGEAHREECPSWAYAKCVRIVELELQDANG